MTEIGANKTEWLGAVLALNLIEPLNCMRVIDAATDPVPRIGWIKDDPALPEPCPCDVGNFRPLVPICAKHLMCAINNRKLSGNGAVIIARVENNRVQRAIDHPLRVGPLPAIKQGPPHQHLVRSPAKREI